MSVNILFLIVIAITTVTSCVSATTSNVRFGMGIPDLLHKVSLTDNNTVIDSLVTPDVTPYGNVSLGIHYFKLVISDVMICLLEFTAQEDETVTIVGAGGYHNRTVEFYTFPDNFTMIDSSSSKIRFLHLGAGAGAINAKVGCALC